MAYIDNILFNGTLEEQQQLKEKFGMGGLEYLDDFAELVFALLHLIAHRTALRVCSYAQSLGVLSMAPICGKV